MLIESKYARQALLRSDSYGEIWSAHDEAGLAVRLRIVPSLGEAVLARLRAPIAHPAIEEIVDCGTLDDGRGWIAAKDVEGETLADLLEREGTLSVEAALRIVEDIAEALRVLHERGACHGRLDPSRVVLGKRGLQLVDVALGVLTENECAEDRTTLPRAEEDVAFLSPEVASGESGPSAESDIWALGVILTRCIAGVNPYEARSRAQLVVEAAVRTVRIRDVDDEVNELIRSCLSHEPILRPTAGEVSGTIREGRPTAVESMHVVPSAPARPRRRVYAALTALAVLLLAVPARGLRRHEVVPAPAPQAVQTVITRAERHFPPPVVVEPAVTTTQPEIDLSPDEPAKPQPTKPKAVAKKKTKGDPFYGVTAPGF